MTETDKAKPENRTGARSDPWEFPATWPNIREDELAAFKHALRQVQELARANGWSKAQVARMAAIPDGTFGSWWSGAYGPDGKNTHNVTQRVLAWLERYHDMEAMGSGIIARPAYLATPTAKEVFSALTFAQRTPGMTVITLGPGMGKTMTCRHYVDVGQHAYLVTMRPQTRTVHGMLTELCRVLDVAQNNPAKLDSAIGERLKRNDKQTLLIVDEAQNLTDQAVDQLRYFLDEYQCGIALVGNETAYTRFAGGNTENPAYAQLSRRVGYRVKRMKPQRDDITQIINALGIEEGDCRRLLAAVGEKDGALGQIVETARLASMFAAGDGKPISTYYISAAARNRLPGGAA